MPDAHKIMSSRAFGSMAAILRIAIESGIRLPVSPARSFPLPVVTGLRALAVEPRAAQVLGICVAHVFQPEIADLVNRKARRASVRTKDGAILVGETHVIPLMQRWVINRVPCRGALFCCLLHLPLLLAGKPASLFLPMVIAIPIATIIAHSIAKAKIVAIQFPPVESLKIARLSGPSFVSLPYESV